MDIAGRGSHQQSRLALQDRCIDKILIDDFDHGCQTNGRM